MCQYVKERFGFVKRLFSFFHAYVIDRSDYFHFFQGLDFSLSLTLPYPIRNSLPFTSLRSVTVGLGRDFLEGETCKGQAHGLLECADSVPVVADVVGHEDGIMIDAHGVRAVVEPWVSTRRPI